MRRDSTLDFGLLVLRVGAGVLLMTHGWGKVVQIVDGQAGQWADPIGLGPHASIWLSAFAEFLCALLVVLGLKTRWFAVPIVINMAVAVIFAHAGDPFGDKELAILYLVVFLAIAFTGGGGWSFDGWLGQRRRHRR